MTVGGSANLLKNIPEDAVLPLCWAAPFELREAFVAIDRENRIIACNRAAAILFECAAEDLIGRRIHPDFLASDRSPRPVTLYSAEGGPIRVEATILPVADTDDVTHGTAILMRRGGSSVIERPEPAGLAAFLVHEMSQPLGAAHNYLRAAASGIADVSSRELYRKALLETERLCRIVSRFREYCRRRELDDAASDFNATIQGALAAMEDELGATVLTLDLAQGLPPIDIDKFMIELLVLNLARNSVASMAGLDRKQLHISTARCGDALAVTVSDSGAGFSSLSCDDGEPLMLYSDKTKGMGIGLSLCAAVVKRHRGTMSIRSNPQQGTRIDIHLPLKQMGDTSAA